MSQSFDIIQQKIMQEKTLNGEKSIVECIHMRQLNHPSLNNQRFRTYVDSLLQKKEFRFQGKDGKGSINFEQFNEIDVAEVVRETNIEKLEYYLENFTYSTVTEHDIHQNNTKNIVKSLHMAQLTIDYLLSVQNELANNLNALAGRYSSKKMKMESLKSLIHDQEEAIKNIGLSLNERCHSIHKNYLPDHPISSLSHPRMSGHVDAKLIRQQYCSTQVTNEYKRTPQKSPGRLLVYIISQEGSFMEISVCESTTVSELKVEIAKLKMYSRNEVGKMSLSLRGRCLSNTDVLGSLGIKDCSILMLKIKEVECKEALPPLQTISESRDLVPYDLNQRIQNLENHSTTTQIEIQEATKLLREEIEQGKKREAMLLDVIDRRFKQMEESFISGIHEISLSSDKIYIQKKEAEQNEDDVNDLDNHMKVDPVETHEIRSDLIARNDEQSVTKRQKMKRDEQNLETITKKDDVSTLSDFSEEFSINADLLDESSFTLSSKPIDQDRQTTKPSLRIDCNTTEEALNMSNEYKVDVKRNSIHAKSSQTKQGNTNDGNSNSCRGSQQECLDKVKTNGPLNDSKLAFSFDVSSSTESCHVNKCTDVRKEGIKETLDAQDTHTATSTEGTKSIFSGSTDPAIKQSKKSKKSRRKSGTSSSKRNRIVRKFVGVMRMNVDKKYTI